MGDIGEKRRYIILEPIPDDIPIEEPSPETAPVPEPEKVPA